MKTYTCIFLVLVVTINWKLCFDFVALSCETVQSHTKPLIVAKIKNSPLENVFVCAHGDSSEENMETLRSRFEKCRKEVGIPEGRPHGPPDPNDPKFKCLHACLMKESGKMVDGKIVVDKIIEFHKKHFPNFNDDTEDKITYCVETANEETDECEIGATMMKCMFEKLGPPPPPPFRRSERQ